MPERQVRIARMLSVLAGLRADKPWQVKVSEYRRNRTLDQNAYLWSCYGRLIAGIPDMEGWDKDDAHEMLLGMYGGTYAVTLSGHTMLRPILSSSKMDTKTFSAYFEFVQRYSAQNGIVIDDPDPRWKEHHDACQSLTA